jgi:hypothetical protein
MSPSCHGLRAQEYVVDISALLVGIADDILAEYRADRLVAQFLYSKKSSKGALFSWPSGSIFIHTACSEIILPWTIVWTFQVDFVNELF